MAALGVMVGSAVASLAAMSGTPRAPTWTVEEVKADADEAARMAALDDSRRP